MASISFEALYDEDAERALTVLYLWLEDFLEGMEAQIAVDDPKARAFIGELADKKKSDCFPANGGFEAASPFKKAAIIYVYLHQDTCNPFLLALKGGKKPKPFSSPSHIASVMGFALVQACLDGAEILKDGKMVPLKSRIDVSQHFMTDLIEASQNIIPETHFKMFSLLFESLAYQTNTKISYDRQFNQEVIVDRPSWY